MASETSPFSLEACNKYTETHPHDDRGVYQWHMHVYSPTDDEIALKHFQSDVSSRFSHDANVVMGRIMLKAGGPHPCAQFEVDFTRTAFADVASWAMFNRPEEMSILIHALDAEQAEAHSTRAMWIGKALECKIEPMKKFDAMVAAKMAGGASLNEVLHKMLGARGGRPSPELIARMRGLEAKDTASSPAAAST